MSNLFYLSDEVRPTVERAEGISIYTTDGRRFVDGSSGALVVNVGHSNPRVLQAMRGQMEQVTFAYRTHFRSESTEAYASALAALMPGDLDRVFLVSGGSEAVESAVKVARQHAVAVGQPERTKVISAEHSYHGATLGSLAITGHRQRVAPYESMLASMPKVPTPAAYLTSDMSTDDAGRFFAAQLETRIQAEGPATVLAYIFEPVGGAATGALVAPDSYYPAVREICDRYGVLLIFDEVMSGAGRTGRFIAAEHWNVVPDVVALSKGLGAGYVPLGAMVTSTRVLAPIVADGGFVHGHTYAGNPLAAAAGRAILAEIADHDLCTNAATLGTQLLTGLAELADAHGFIGDVRGKGMLTAIELVADRDTMTPLPSDAGAATALAEHCYGHGLIVYPGRSRDGYRGDHVLVGPPLNSTAEEVAEVLDRLAAGLMAFGRSLSAWTGPGQPIP